MRSLLQEEISKILLGNPKMDSFSAAEAAYTAKCVEAGQHYANAAFFRSCALSGELPRVGSEPFPMGDR